jgi:hypothetical protein
MAEHYFVGRHPDDTKVDEHVNRLRLAQPQDRSGSLPFYAKTTPASELAADLLATGQSLARQPPLRSQPMQLRVTCSLTLQLGASKALAPTIRPAESTQTTHP